MYMNKAVQKTLIPFFARIPENEHDIWFDEAVRLSSIVIRYQQIERKRRINNNTGKSEFTKEVYDLCKEAVCSNLIIILREPSRSRPPSPYTLDRWSKNYNSIGIRTFFRNPSVADPQNDNRRAFISVDAYKWTKKNWKKFTAPTAFYKEIKKESEEHIWKIPSKSWFYRNWQTIPKAVSVFYFEGMDAYQSKVASYVPRDMSNLDALQVLCGDHRECDVTVHIGKGKLARCWLTYWLDLRTLLIWGWYLSLTPNSEAIALAYADGIDKFGAQPFSRPEDGFYSYIYTDRGKSYLAHDISGNVIKVHERAADITGKFKYFLVERSIGLVEDFSIGHLIAKSKNPKEKPIERTNLDFSTWEKNTFEAYCGNKPSNRPDAWYRLFEKHEKLVKKDNFNSPFPSLREYKAKIAERINEHNSIIHERYNLGGILITPIEEFNSLYTTRYEIPQDLVATLLLKSKVKTIGKNGVICFQKNYSYWHDSMAEVADGVKVQIKFTDQDYKKIWVVMPDKKLVEAKLVEPVAFLNPNKETLKMVKKMEAKKRETIRNFHLLQQSNLRFENTEKQLIHHQLDEPPSPDSQLTPPKSSVIMFPPYVKETSAETDEQKNISAEKLTKIESKIEILPEVETIKINEFK